MASLHTGSDELVYIQTDKVSVTIKGPASHPHNQGAEHNEKESFLKVLMGIMESVKWQFQIGKR